MMLATGVTLLMIPIFLLIILVPVALVIVLQVWLCKKGGKWLGLLLPGLSLAMSLVICLSFASFGTAEGGNLRVTDEHGNVIQEEHHQPEHRQLQMGDVAAVGGMFLVFNIPTLALGGIWLYYKNRREWKDDLKKMNIEDLE